MARFPQVDWVAVNGQDTPFTKPQHYKEGSKTDTDLTGHDNPLPVAGYGMTEGGLWIPRRVDDEGRTLTQLTGSIVENVVPRRTISSSEAGYRIRPSNITSALIELVVHEISGTENSPVRLSTFNRVSGNASTSLELLSDYAGVGRTFHLWCSNTSLGDATTGNNIIDFKSSNIPIVNQLAYAVYIRSGNQAEVEVNISWIL